MRTYKLRAKQGHKRVTTVHSRERNERMYTLRAERGRMRISRANEAHQCRERGVEDATGGTGMDTRIIVVVVSERCGWR